VEIGFVIDCRDPEALAPFWAAALGYVVAGSVENYVTLLPETGDGPKLLLQRVPEAKTGKNGMHLDIEAPDIEAMAADLVARGGSRLKAEIYEEHGCCWIAMADPDGNEFCLCCHDR
jgi:predicted enzyme related to lactoylglutathione lyase